MQHAKKRSVLKSKKSSCPTFIFIPLVCNVFSTCFEVHSFFSQNPNFHLLLSFLARRGKKQEISGDSLFSFPASSCTWMRLPKRFYSIPLFLVFHFSASLPSLKRLHWKPIFLQRRSHNKKVCENDLGTVTYKFCFYLAKKKHHTVNICFKKRLSIRFVFGHNKIVAMGKTNRKSVCPRSFVRLN